MALPTKVTRPCAGMLVGFAVISLLMVLGLTGAWDADVLHWVGTVRTPWLTDLMLVATTLGDGLVEVPFAIGVGLLLWRLGRPRCARLFVFSALSAEVLYVIMKASFQRPRPTVIEKLSSAGWYSYPSGHAMLAPVIWGLGLLLLSRSVAHAGARRTLLALALVIPPMIAVSRVYLGVHYPSDVIGALLLGTGWIMLWLTAPRNLGLPAPSLRSG